jgi:hypothetical protein
MWKTKSSCPDMVVNICNSSCAEMEMRRLKFQTSPDVKVSETLSQKTSQGLGYGSSGRAPDYQSQSSEFKPQHGARGKKVRHDG